METKKKKNYVLKMLVLLFIIYIFIYFIHESGYYSKIDHRTIITKEAMLQFENDLNNGETIDIKDYLKAEHTDYSNNITKFGNKLTNSLSNFMTKGFNGLFNSLKGLFWD